MVIRAASTKKQECGRKKGKKEAIHVNLTLFNLISLSKSKTKPRGNFCLLGGFYEWSNRTGDFRVS
jgi:hypothetical protein